MNLMCSSPRSGLGSSGRYISNVSLDVLPVKGPPLSPSEPVLKQTELNLENTWSIKPEQLVLTAPTISKTHLSLRMWYWKWLQVVQVYNINICLKQMHLAWWDRMHPPPNVIFCWLICRQCSWHQACANTEPLKQRAELWAVLACPLPYHHPTARSHWTSVRDFHINKHQENQ